MDGARPGAPGDAAQLHASPCGPALTGGGISARARWPSAAHARMAARAWAVRPCAHQGRDDGGRLRRRLPERGPIDGILEKIGITRDIATRVGGCSAANALARATNLVATVLERYTRAYPKASSASRSRQGAGDHDLDALAFAAGRRPGASVVAEPHRGCKCDRPMKEAKSDKN